MARSFFRTHGDRAEDLEAMYGVKPLCELPVLRQCVYANYALAARAMPPCSPVKELSGPQTNLFVFCNFN